MTFARAAERQIPNREIKEEGEKKVERVDIFPQDFDGKGNQCLEGVAGARKVLRLVGLLLFSNKRDLNMSVPHEGWLLEHNEETSGMESGTSRGESKGLLGSHMQPGDIGKHNSVVNGPVWHGS